MVFDSLKQIQAEQIRFSNIKGIIVGIIFLFVGLVGIIFGLIEMSWGIMLLFLVVIAIGFIFVIINKIGLNLLKKQGY